MKIPDLPEDLEAEILSRVPATSLSRFRSTCKRWYALFKDPRFIKKNLSKAATQVILKKDHRVYSGIINHNGIHNNIEFTGELNNSEHVKISEISICDGLLLCTTKEERLVVKNPCTAQIRWIKQSNGYLKASFHRYYLGYNDNYKILSTRIRLKNYNIVVGVIEIYEFNSYSWRVLDDITHYWYQWYQLSGGGVSLKGNTYWFNKCKTDHPFDSILLFDFTTVSLERLSFPFESSDECAVLSSVREEKLVLLRPMFDLGLFKMKTWVADTKIDEETKDLPWNNFAVVDFSKFDAKIPVDFLWDEENKMVVYCDKDRDDEGHERIIIHIVGENTHKEVYKEIINESQYDSPLLLSYVPSLVQIQQATNGG